MKAGADWDYKAHPDKYWPASDCPTGTCGGTVTICGKCYNRDVPGNVNFGFTGYRGCISETILHLGANYASVSSGAGLDSSEDSAAIDIGIRLAKRGGMPSRALLCEEFEKNDSKLEKAGTQGCAPSSTVFPNAQ